MCATAIVLSRMPPEMSKVTCGDLLQFANPVEKSPVFPHMFRRAICGAKDLIHFTEEGKYSGPSRR